MHDQLRKSITALVFALSGTVLGAALAQIPETPIAFKADAPDRYVVVDARSDEDTVFSRLLAGLGDKLRAG